MKNLLAVLALSLPLAANAQPPATPRTQSLSVNYQRLPLETALRHTFLKADRSFVIPYDLAERVTLQLKDEPLETILTKLLETTPEALECIPGQEVWQVRKKTASGSYPISLSLKNTPLRAALTALQPYLPNLTLVLDGISPTKRVTYLSNGIAPRQALAELLKISGPSMRAETTKDGTLEVRFGTLPPFTGKLDLDFRRATLEEAVQVLAQKTGRDTMILLPDAEKSKVTLRLEQATFEEALRQICRHCVPPVGIKESDGLYLIFPKK